ncbi:MAG: TIGR03668 family PPOX class F420-dependent oxidoreductase [Chloroflexi bacterium]|nr:TIGR03668 family PPOX class F420-dependent oxidoreductase [Chloroflexota bacterium]
MAARFTPQVARLLGRARVAHLATADAAGRPHVVPIVFAFDGQRLYSAVDEKPKRVGPGQLRRVRNLRERPRAAVVVDRYDEDWSRLVYVLLEGPARLLEAGAEHARAVELLRAKYPQYVRHRLEERPIIALDPERVVAWGRLEEDPS